MIFKTGDKVEVMNNKDLPVSWRTAEVLSRSGGTYIIQYDNYIGMASEQLVDMVSPKFVRPCPSLLQHVPTFIAADIVEVLHHNSWKIAVVLSVVGGKTGNTKNKIHYKDSTFKNQYLVRLLGCSKELIVDGSNIRIRQTWHGGKWVPMGKIPQVGDDVIVSKPSRAKSQPREDCGFIQYDAAQKESAVISSRSLKRMSPYISSFAEANNGHVQKFRATEKQGRKQRVVADRVIEKVDAVAYPKETLGETYMHASYDIISNGYNKMKREKQNDVLGYSGFRGSEINSFDSDACSVGSCSVPNPGLENYYSHFMPVHCQERDTLSSDAESSYGPGSERKSSSVSLKEEVEVRIHSLELHAYRSTLEALYASGPLSWEQEALLTNLRIMLHISNDEHLKELKHLISTKTAITLR